MLVVFLQPAGTSVRLRCLLSCWRSHMWGVKNTERKKSRGKKEQRYLWRGTEQAETHKSNYFAVGEGANNPISFRDNSAVGKKSKSFRFTSPCVFLVFPSFQSSSHSTPTVERVTCFNLRLLLGSQMLAWRALLRKMWAEFFPPGSGSCDGRYGNCALLAAPYVPVTQFDPSPPLQRSRVSQDCYNNHNATKLGLAFTPDWGPGNSGCITSLAPWSSPDAHRFIVGGLDRGLQGLPDWKLDKKNPPGI